MRRRAGLISLPLRFTVPDIAMPLYFCFYIVAAAAAAADTPPRLRGA